MRTGKIRQGPAESMSLGRVFRFRESIALSRMTFLNIFNTTQLSNSTATNPLAAMTCSGASDAVCANPATAGQLTGGFGFNNYVGGSTFLPPRPRHAGDVNTVLKEYKRQELEVSIHASGGCHVQSIRLELLCCRIDYRRSGGTLRPVAGLSHFGSTTDPGWQA